MKAAASRTRWGILGTGTSAQQFAIGLAYLRNARLVAVAAHSQAAADAFGEGNWVPRRYGAFAALADDPDIDVVYLATPPRAHTAHVRMCLQAGKAVICDVPFAADAEEAAELIALAREQGLFLMAGISMRFLPLSARLRVLLAEGAIGETRMLTADIGLRPLFDPLRRARAGQPNDEALASAGAELAVLASMVFGAPARVTSEMHLDPAGGGQAATILTYEGGQLAALLATTHANSPQEATIIGDAGWIRIHPRWWAPEAFTLTIGLRPQLIHMPVLGNGASYVADEVMRCLRAGRLESAVMPLDETLAIVRTLDQMRKHWGLAASDSVE